MKLHELRMQFIRSYNLIKVYVGETLVYMGPAFLSPPEYEAYQIKELGFDLETRRRDWKEAGTWAPLCPDETACVLLKDVEQRVYWRITLRERTGDEQ